MLAAAGRQPAQQADPYSVLRVARGSSRRAIRAAYIEQIKLLHPDVSSASGEDTTREAAALNAAYEALMAGGREQGWTNGVPWAGAPSVALAAGAPDLCLGEPSTSCRALGQALTAADSPSPCLPHSRLLQQLVHLPGLLCPPPAPPHSRL